MTFTDLPAGETVFVDANTFVYHCSRHAQFGMECTDLMGRIERGELYGVTTTHVLSETSHRLMTLEAITVLNWPTTGIGNRLRRHPADVSRLTHFRQAIEEIVQSKIKILLTTPNLLVRAVVLSQQIGLLTNDALIVAVMQANGLTHLASNDADFDRLAGLTRYAPV